MAFTVTFPTRGPSPQLDSAAEWLTAYGEPFEAEGATCLALRALPMRLRVPAGQPMQALVEVTAAVRLSRVVDLIFELSTNAGADVRLTGSGTVNRPQLWMRLADEQDRIRIAEAIERSAEHGNQEAVLQRMWRIVNALRADRDDRWDAQHRRICEMVEVGREGPGGVSLEAAAWLHEAVQPGDVVPVPVDGFLHSLTWRWLSEAYPGLAEDPTRSR